MDDPVLVAGLERGDAPEGGIAARDVGIGEVRPVQEVQRLAAELELVFFRDTEIAQDGDVHVDRARAVPNGWRKAYGAARLNADPTLCAVGELSVKSGRAATARLLDLPSPPTALFIDNLVVATGAIHTLRERSLDCPRDVEIVSFDDAEWLDVFDPPITTIVQASYELGVKAAEVLLKRIRHPRRPNESLFLKPSLRVRDRDRR